MKIFLPLLITVILFTLSPAVVHAKVWINEFSSNGSSDWVELYNQSEESADVSGLWLRDSSATNKLILEGTIEPNAFVVFEWSDKLNNSGDTIKLVSASDETTIHDQVSYGSSSDITAPAANQTGGRKTDGGSLWVVFTIASRNASNAESQPAPTATAVPEKTPTPKKEPTPTKTPTAKKEPTIKATTAASAKEELHESSTATTSIKSGATKLLKISGVPTSILGIATISAVPKPSAKISSSQEGEVMVKDASSSPFFMMIAGALFCLACAILMFLKWKNKKHEARDNY